MWGTEMGIRDGMAEQEDVEELKRKAEGTLL